MTFLAAAAPFLALAGTGVEAIGSIESGLYANQVAQNNATIAEQNKAYTLQAGEEAASVQSRKGAAEQGALKTRMGASGVDVNSGSNVDVQVGAREASKLDAETVLNNAELAAYGYTTQAANFRAQGAQDLASGIWDAAGGLLGSASSLGFKYSGEVSGSGAG